MLAHEGIAVSGLVEKIHVAMGDENLLGVKLPKIVEVTSTVREYSLLSKPHWVDNLVEQLLAVLEIRAWSEVTRQRIAILEKAMRRTTQRVNLFEKVLIPEAEQALKKIRLLLAENERAAVVRAKITKKLSRKM